MRLVRHRTPPQFAVTSTHGCSCCCGSDGYWEDAETEDSLRMWSAGRTPGNTDNVAVGLNESVSEWLPIISFRETQCFEWETRHWYDCFLWFVLELVSSLGCIVYKKCWNTVSFHLFIFSVFDPVFAACRPLCSNLSQYDNEIFLHHNFHFTSYQNPVIPVATAHVCISVTRP